MAFRSTLVLMSRSGVAVECMWGLLAADALAMPVHWYYNPYDIKKGYGGWLKGYRAPNDHHPTSILRLSATGGSGRSAGRKASRPVIGRLILHDKLKYWTDETHVNHYHQGMSAGDNTLNGLLALESYRTLSTLSCEEEPSRDAREAVIEHYVAFMTRPESHNDTYAESCHRLFFHDWDNVIDSPKDGSGLLDFCTQRYQEVTKEDSQLASIGALVLVVPWVLHYYETLTREACAAAVTKALHMTHPAPSLMPYVACYAELLYNVLHGHDLKEEVEKALSHKAFGSTGQRTLAEMKKFSAEAQQYAAGSEDRLAVYQDAVSHFGLACYINTALRSMLFLAREFHDDFEAGILANANCGGENAHRGAALGALLAANAFNKGQEIPQRWKNDLGSKATLQSIIEN